jgi:hypothetical protein
VQPVSSLPLTLSLSHGQSGSLVSSTPGMSNRGSPEGHMGHIRVVMRATHNMRPAGRMFDMPDIQYVFFIQNAFYTWK